MAIEKTYSMIKPDGVRNGHIGEIINRFERAGLKIERMEMGMVTPEQAAANYAEHEGNRMVRKGDWKLVSANFKGDEWELYNIKEDRTEQHNLIGKYPEMAKELETAYFEWADKSDVLYFQKMWNTYNKNRRKDFKEYKTR